EVQGGGDGRGLRASGGGSDAQVVSLAEDAADPGDGERAAPAELFGDVERTSEGDVAREERRGALDDEGGAGIDPGRGPIDGDPRRLAGGAEAELAEALQAGGARRVAERGIGGREELGDERPTARHALVHPAGAATVLHHRRRAGGGDLQLRH